jgi:hypothetical protein
VLRPRHSIVARFAGFAALTASSAVGAAPAAAPAIAPGASAPGRHCREGRTKAATFGGCFACMHYSSGPVRSRAAPPIGRAGYPSRSGHGSCARLPSESLERRGSPGADTGGAPRFDNGAGRHSPRRSSQRSAFRGNEETGTSLKWITHLGESTREVNLLDPAAEQASGPAVRADAPLPVGEPCGPHDCRFASRSDNRLMARDPGAAGCRLYEGGPVVKPSCQIADTVTVTLPQVHAVVSSAKSLRRSHKEGRARDFGQCIAFGSGRSRPLAHRSAAPVRVHASRASDARFEDDLRPVAMQAPSVGYPIVSGSREA